MYIHTHAEKKNIQSPVIYAYTYIIHTGCVAIGDRRDVILVTGESFYGRHCHGIHTHTHTHKKSGSEEAPTRTITRRSARDSRELAKNKKREEKINVTHTRYTDDKMNIYTIDERGAEYR